VSYLESQLLLIDKPLGASSFDIVAIIRNSLTKELGEKVKVSHTGTLDPLATGVLLILIGKATKAQDIFLKQDKRYRFIVKLGEKTSTADLEGEITEKKKVPKLTEVKIKKTLKKFVRLQKQTVPLFSAVKVEGKRLYKYARQNKTPNRLPSKDIEIFSLKLLSYNSDKLELQLAVHCSSGTYVRSLAEDIAKALNTVGHVVNLQRTKSGEFELDDCSSIDLHYTN